MSASGRLDETARVLSQYLVTKNGAWSKGKVVVVVGAVLLGVAAAGATTYFVLNKKKGKHFWLPKL